MTRDRGPVASSGHLCPQRAWTLRVAQVFEVEAATSDEALAFAHKLRARKARGAKLIDGMAVIGETDDE